MKEIRHAHNPNWVSFCAFTVHHNLLCVFLHIWPLFGNVCFELFRILMSVWIFLVFSSFRQLLCASHFGTLQSDGGPWRTIHNFSTFSSRIYFWREREWYAWYCDRTSIPVWIEYDKCDFTLFSCCCICRLSLIPWRLRQYIPPKHLHPSTRLCGVITQKTTVLFTSGCSYIKVKNMSQLISTYNLCQGCCYSVMTWVLGSILRLFSFSGC